MKRDRVSMEILSVLKESTDNKNNKQVLTEMPQRLKIRKRVRGYDFNDLDWRTKQRLTGDERNSLSDVQERFQEDAKLDLNNKLNAIVPGVFTTKYGSPASYKDDGYDSGNTYLEVNLTKLVDALKPKFPELEVTNDGFFHGDRDFSVKYSDAGYAFDDRESKLRKMLSRNTNFDDLRRQQKVAINDYLAELVNAVRKAIIDNINEFNKKRKEYDKYTNLSAKEREDELSKNWYDEHGRVIRAKNLDESFIKEYNLKEAKDLDVDDYIEIFDFDELSDYAKEELTSKKINSQIQKMFDRMTEILEKEFTEYMSARGLELEPGQFDIDKLLYNMTHSPSSSRHYYGPHYMTRFYITKGELMSYIRNNPDLAEKYGQDEIDRLLNYMTTDKGDSQPVYILNFDGNKVVIDSNYSFKSSGWDEDKYFDGADKELEKLYQNLEKELSLDFYSAYKSLNKAMKQLRDEAKEIVYAKMAKSKDKYLSNGKKFNRDEYNIIEEEPTNTEENV